MSCPAPAPPRPPRRSAPVRGAVAAMLVAAAWATPLVAAETAADVATRALLEQLEERRMPDVAIWVLDRVAADPSAAPELKAEVPFRRALALVGLSRTEADSKKRAAQFEEARTQIDAFLTASPEGRRAIDAYSQKGNLLIEQGRLRLEQAKRPGADVAALRKEAIGLFDEALKALEGKVKPGEPITKVDNAEDAVIKELRAVDDRIKELRPKDDDKDAKDDKDDKDDKEDGKKPPRPKRPAKRDPARDAELERLEADQTALRSKLVQTRLMAANALFEKSKAYDAKSKEWQQALEKSTEQFAEVADKYPNLGGGLLARYYQGRNLAALEKRELAIGALAALVAIDEKQKSPLAIMLRSKSLSTTLECWLADKKYDAFDQKMRSFALTNISAARLDADWLALKYRAALMLKEQAATLKGKDAAKGKAMLSDASKLAGDVAKANRDFADEARELLEALGKGGIAAAEATFDSLMDDARVSLATMQQRQVEARQEKDAAKQQELLAKVAEARGQTIRGIQAALRLSDDADPAAANQARYLLTYLLYESQRFHDAATVGAFLAERYPNAKGSRQAAKIAMASWQQLEKQPATEWQKEARARCAGLADLIMRTWPAEAESADAAVIAIMSATESRDPARILEVAAKMPAESPRRGEVLARAGTALWREVMEQGRLEEGSRAPAETVAGWKKAARENLDVGLKSPPGQGAAFRSTVAAALARCQIALDDGDAKAAVAMLENPAYGPWTVVNDPKADALLREGTFGEAVLTVSLRSFIQAEQLDKAQRAMDLLEKLAGAGGSEDASARLTAMYLSMGRELQEQLERLGGGGGTADAEARAKAMSILGGFEKFLDGLAKRDPKVSSQIWVATTYLTLGSGKGTGAVVPKAQAEKYLDRAADVYKQVLEKQGDADVARFEPSIRLRMASIYRERGRWDEAQEQIDWILSDPKRQNSLDTQVQAAELLQASAQALAATDAAAADARYREATAGRKGEKSVIWGWGGIASKVGRQAFSGSDEKALKSRELFFTARLNQAACLLARALLPGKSPDQARDMLSKAEAAVALTRKMYPDLGGAAMQGRFEKLLKDIQKQQGSANPRGFAELDERAAAEAAPAAAAN